MFRVKDHYIFKLLFHKDSALDFQCDHSPNAVSANKTAFGNATVRRLGTQVALF